MKTLRDIFLVSWFLATALFVNKIYASEIDFVKVVDTTTFIPKGVGAFQHFDNPFLYDGKVVFRAYGSDNQAGIYSNWEGNLAVVADRNMSIPKGKGNFTSFGESDESSEVNINSPTLDDEGIVFVGEGDNNQQGIYILAPNQLRLVADRNTVMPKGISKFKNFFDPYITNNEIAFAAKGIDNQYGLYVYSNNVLRAFYDVNKIFPNKKNRLTEIDNVSFSRNYAAFCGEARDGTKGIYVYSSGNSKKLDRDPKNGVLTTEVDQRTQIPNGEGNFVSFGRPALMHSKVVFRGEGSNGQIGLYSNFSHKLERIADLNTPIPQGRGNFTDMSSPSVDNQNIVFRGAGENGQQGIYLYQDSKLKRILDNSQTLDNKKIAGVSLGAVALSQNKVAIHVIFQDKSEAIYLTKI